MVLFVIFDEYKMFGYICILWKLELINLIMCFGDFVLIFKEIEEKIVL